VGTLILVCGVLLVAATGVLVGACFRLPSVVGFLLAVYLVASAQVIVVSLALSIVDALTRTWLLLAVAGTFALALAAWLRLGRPRQSLASVVPAAREALGDRAVSVLAALAAALYGYLVVVALAVPQSLPDTMLYHLPRAALWKQQHALGYVANAPDERIDVFPPGAEIQSAVSMIWSEGDRFVGLVQLLAIVAACVAILGIARRLGLSRAAGAFGGLAFATFTVVALQAPTALNDLVVAALLVICAYFAMGPSRADLGLAALALALAVGTKGTVVFALPALALFVLASQPRGRWPSLALAGAVGLVAGSFWYAVNLVEAGELTGGVSADRGTDSVLERIRLSFVDLLELSDGEGKGLLASLGWSLVPLAVAVVIAFMLALRRRFRASGVAVLVGVIAFFVAPLLVTWMEVADRVLGRARAAVGLGSGPASRLPEGFTESPMHSSYGLAFVVLFVGAGVLIVSDVVRRRVSLAALTALVGVPLTLVLTAFALAYDPQRMRYIAFAVALASSVFGVALRVRALAWTAVALAVTTTAISVAYFVPRPASLTLLSGNRTPERSARWFIQGESGNGDPEAFRFLEEQIPADAVVALDVVRNTYLYPAWDAGLRRTILFVPGDGDAPVAAGWLVVGPSKSVPETRLAAEGWKLELASPGGWRVYGR
jgi:Dolichyl-phosphate-mannose-protein mannosyltransferase